MRKMTPGFVCLLEARDTSEEEEDGDLLISRRGANLARRRCERV